MVELLSNAIRYPTDKDFIVNAASNTFSLPLNSTREIFKKELSPWLDYPATGMVIAYDGDRPVGFALHRLTPYLDNVRKIFQNALGEISPRIEYDSSARDISMLAVDKDMRRKGIGTGMVQSIIDDLIESQETEQLYAICWKGRFADSYNLFRRSGFTALKEFPDLYADHTPGLAMIRWIPQADRKHYKPPHPEYTHEDIAAIL